MERLKVDGAGSSLMGFNPDAHGLVFNTQGARAETIRDEDEYSGVRVTMTASLARAQVTFHIDVNVGDPVSTPGAAMRYQHAAAAGDAEIARAALGDGTGA